MKKLLIPFVLCAAVILAIAAVPRRVSVDSANTYICAGTVVTTGDSTVTNTFSTAFGAAPIVVVTPLGNGNLPITNIICTVTTTGFILNTHVPSMTNRWIAVGTL